MSLFRVAEVYVQGSFAGVLCETDFGYEFKYDESYLISENPKAVSLTLPLSSIPYQSKTLFSFFDGLIPEGWLFDIAIKSWKIKPQDRFGALLCTCRDCIGDVSVREVQP